MQAAEDGRLDHPELVWFHADWWVICQSITSTVSALEKRYAGQARVVRVNVDSSEACAYIQKYRVRATPTFVLFNRHGRMIWNTAGWMGEDQVAQAFDALIAQPE